MRTQRKYHKTHMTRPRKSGAAKNRRRLEQKRRLLALGMPEDDLAKLNEKDVRTLLKHPKKVEAKYAEK